MGLGRAWRREDNYGELVPSTMRVSAVTLRGHRDEASIFPAELSLQPRVLTVPKSTEEL